MSKDDRKSSLGTPKASPAPTYLSLHSSPPSTPRAPTKVPSPLAQATFVPPENVLPTFSLDQARDPPEPSDSGTSLRPSRPRGSSVSTIQPSQDRAVPEHVTRLASTPATLSRKHLTSRSPSPASPVSPVSVTSRDNSPLRGIMRRNGGTETPRNGAPSSWWNSREPVPRPWEPKRQHSIPKEQTEGWERTRQRVAHAAVVVLGTAGEVTHELLSISADALELAPLPGLAALAKGLLNIWDALQQVDTNRLACLRLTDRCATILISVREEIHEAGDQVGQELLTPIARLVETFMKIHGLMLKQNRRPFLKRYLKRDEVLRSISECETDLQDAMGMFSMAIQVRILKKVLALEQQRRADAEMLHEYLLHESPSHRDKALPALPALTSRSLPSTSHVLDLPGLDDLHALPALDDEGPQITDVLDPAHLRTPAEIRAALHTISERQSVHDTALDLADMRALMRAALAAGSDAAMLRVLQVGHDEMPEAIKALKRALEAEEERERAEEQAEQADVVAELVAEAVSSPVGLFVEKTEPQVQARGADLARKASVASHGSQKSAGVSSSTASTRTRRSGPRDTLDREFMEGGIDALRRLSGAEVPLPSWTITRYEVDREEKIGIGYFSNVYKGTWRGRTVAIKVLAETTPRPVFVREMSIWKKLKHKNVLELYGASSASGDPPWFFVSPYCRHGSVVEYLRGLPSLDSVNLLKMIDEIVRGMGYLHVKGVLHGDLKGANVLVNDRLHCVISDFGQSEMKSEVYRISGAGPPHGTFRWQAPELMGGQGGITQATDVYAFAITAVEILNKGMLPWPTADDEAVRHFVLTQNMRPELPLGRAWSQRLADIVHRCWALDPKLRPSFARVEQELKQLRARVGSDFHESPNTPNLPLPDTKKSPDMRPGPLQPLPPDVWVDDGTQTASSSGTYFTAHVHHEPTGSRPVSSRAASDTAIYQRTQPSTRRQSISSESDTEGRISPDPEDEERRVARDERRYRMLLQHEFHTSLTLPLWTPTQVSLGAVGYHEKPSGKFVTLFNAFEPDGRAQHLPSLSGYGKITTGLQRYDKRSIVQVGADLVQSFIPTRSSTEASTSRRYTSQLHMGHKCAHLFTEVTTYRYVEDLAPLKHWFRLYVDKVLDLYRSDHPSLSREDVYLVIGTLEAQEYALFVSHSHPDGHVSFNVYSTRRPGKFWGRFETTDAYHIPPPTHTSQVAMTSSQLSGMIGPYYEEPVVKMANAEKVSNFGRGTNSDEWPAVLLARLRFKTDGEEPTSL